MTDAERRRAACRAAARILKAADLGAHAMHEAGEICQETHGAAACPVFLAVLAELERIRDDLARAGAVKDDLPALPTSPR